MTSKAEIDAFLKGKGIQYVSYQHKPAMTINDLKDDPGKLDKAPFVKNLIYKDKKGMYFIVAEGDSSISTGFWKSIGTSKNKIKFAREDDLKKISAYKGSVSIFNVLNDTDKIIKNLIFDEKLKEHDFWSFHPQSNEFTYEIS